MNYQKYQIKNQETLKKEFKNVEFKKEMLQKLLKEKRQRY